MGYHRDGRVEIGDSSHVRITLAYISWDDYNIAHIGYIESSITLHTSSHEGILQMNSTDGKIQITLKRE
ncbi:hypothetical protein [Clostridium sp. Marseille-Q2269]|uniref:hypothetical protein n=1 Tax=Clostridium sp. Marseille-Q2269 TaxID=2942205 RepID=UPI0020740936|nr:hypothetical protein [Clostridium sp. Marseille-Q2269]